MLNVALMMKRFLIPLIFLASPAAAWDFTPTPICTLTHQEAAGQVVVTYDASIPEYTITLTRTDPWPEAPFFGMSFVGQRGGSIGTDRHTLSEDGRSLTVKDSGFGNVLDGLEFNDTALGTSGDATLTFSLDGAAPAVAAFRACPAVVTS